MTRAIEILSGGQSMDISTPHGNAQQLFNQAIALRDVYGGKVSMKVGEYSTEFTVRKGEMEVFKTQRATELHKGKFHKVKPVEDVKGFIKTRSPHWNNPRNLVGSARRRGPGKYK